MDNYRDGRIGHSHVPGPDGKPGFGGVISEGYSSL